MRKPQVLIIHGFNVADGGRATVGKLRGYCAALGWPYAVLNYGWFGLLQTRFKNDNIARRVAAFVKAAHEAGDEVIIIGHSNGCAIAYLAITEYRCAPEHCVFINPALHADKILPEPTTYDVWHSPSDRPVKWSKLLFKTKFRPWGDMGAVGATVKQPNVKNFNKETDFPIVSNAHSDVFDIERLGYFARIILNTAQRHFI